MKDIRTIRIERNNIIYLFEIFDYKLNEVISELFWINILSNWNYSKTHGTHLGVYKYLVHMSKCSFNDKPMFYVTTNTTLYDYKHYMTTNTIWLQTLCYMEWNVLTKSKRFECFCDVFITWLYSRKSVEREQLLFVWIKTQPIFWGIEMV